MNKNIFVKICFNYNGEKGNDTNNSNQSKGFIGAFWERGNLAPQEWVRHRTRPHNKELPSPKCQQFQGSNTGLGQSENTVSKEIYAIFKTHTVTAKLQHGIVFCYDKITVCKCLYTSWLTVIQHEASET